MVLVLDGNLVESSHITSASHHVYIGRTKGPYDEFWGLDEACNPLTCFQSSINLGGNHAVGAFMRGVSLGKSSIS